MSIVECAQMIIKMDMTALKDCMRGGGQLKNDNKSVAKAFVMILQVGITMLAPILVCGWFGLWLNDTFQIIWGFLVCMILGVLAGFRNFFQIMRQFYEKDLKREMKEQQYFEQLKQESKSQRESKKEK